VKFGPVVSEEKILIEIALCFHVVVPRISSNISGRTGPNFAIFSPYENPLRADDGSVLYFPICQGTLPWQPNNVAEMKANRYYVHFLHVRQMAARFRFATTCNATISCKILVKISPVVLAKNILIKIALHVHIVVRRISSNISGFTGLIFAIFSPYECALCADDPSIPYLPICQGTLPRQPNNIAIMMANWYYMHSLDVRQMLTRFRVATTCY